jgi:septum formation protein
MSKNVLYLASQSPSRQNLLKIAGIPFYLASHASDECSVPILDDFYKYALAIAQDKMRHVQLPEQACYNDQVFVLTADTIVKIVDSDLIFGKPEDKQDAVRMLRAMQKRPAEVATGCCIEKRQWKDEAWKTLERREFFASAIIEFVVNDDEIEDLFIKMPLSLHAAGAAIIEEYGMNHLKTISGSFTAVLGLPLFEVRQVLREMKF